MALITSPIPPLTFMQDMIVRKFYECYATGCAYSSFDANDIERHITESSSCLPVRTTARIWAETRYHYIPPHELKVIPRPIYRCTLCHTDFTMLGIIAHFHAQQHGPIFQPTYPQLYYYAANIADENDIAALSTTSPS